MSSDTIKLTVNGIEKILTVRNADTLLHALRNNLGFTSVKPGCHNGDCGSCTVLIDQVPFNACQMLAVEAAGLDITTIEGLSGTELQKAFVDNWAIQCGYCTPGYIINGYALVNNHPDADERTIDEWLDSNICRCTGYQEIKQAIKNEMAKRNNYGQTAE